MANEKASIQSAPKSPLLEQARRRARTLRIAKRTEEAYIGWINRFLTFHRERQKKWIHPLELGSAGVNEYLTHLAADRNVAASTHVSRLGASGVQSPLDQLSIDVSSLSRQR